jgi:hypothetical protein
MPKSSGLLDCDVLQLGTVNLLTPEVVAGAAQEYIKTGQSVRLDWSVVSFLTCEQMF